MAKSRSTRWLLVLSFPLMVAAIWSALAVFANYQRNQLVEQLTQQLTAGNVRGSLAAVRQLALTPHPLFEPIVAAATSTDRSLATGAQLAISDLVDQWQQQLDAGCHARLVSDGLEELAAALDANHESFSAADGPWITRTVAQLVRLANRVSPEGGFEFTAHCESLLAAAGQGRAPSAGTTVRPETSPAAPKETPRESQSAAPQQMRSKTDQVGDLTPLREFAASPAAESAFSTPPVSAYQRIAAPDAASAAPQSDDRSAPSAKSTSQTDAKSGWMLQSSVGGKSRSKEDSFNASGEGGASAKNANDAPPAADALKTVDSRSLFQRWLSSSDGARSPLERELARRGFVKPNVDLARIVFSERVDDRVRLVQELMAAPGMNTKAWLLLLTDDPDAEVRLAAVTMMATSTDPQLAEQAYQAAIHDRDPRVADLAGRLRDRRDNVERR